MIGPRRLRMLALAAACGIVPLLLRAGDNPKSKPKDSDTPKAEAKPARGGFPVTGEDPPQPFVPLKPRTAREQARVEALHDYAAARALEDQRRWAEALKLLERAHEKDPDSVAVLRRLALLSFGGGQSEAGEKYAREALAAEPDDAATIALLVEHYKADPKPGRLEGFLKGLLAEPRLAKDAPARLLALKALGDCYVDQLARPDLPDAAQGKLLDAAGDAEAKLFEALEGGAFDTLDDVNRQRILGEEPAGGFKQIGRILLLARRQGAAIRALRQGRELDPVDPDLPELLADALLKDNKPAEALEVIDALLKRDPRDLAPFELMARALTALKRPKEIIPRLEAAAKEFPKNAALRFVLADRYREAGQGEKAREVLRDLIEHQDDPRGLGALAESLHQQKKAVELVKLLDGSLPGLNAEQLAQGEALAQQGQFEPLAAQVFDKARAPIEAIVNDPPFADQLLEAGAKLLADEPPDLGRGGRLALVYIARKAGRFDKLVELDRAAVKRDPSVTTYLELCDSLVKADRPDEAAATLREFLRKNPDRRDPRLVLQAARFDFTAGKYRDAVDATREVLKDQPGDINAMLLLGAALARAGKAGEAVAHYKGMLERFADAEEIVKLVRSGLSAAYVDQGDFKKGEAELEILLEKDPDDFGVNNDLGYLLADQGKDLEKAEAMIRKAVEGDPDNGAYLDSLGWVLFRRDKPEEAVAPLEKASKQQGSDATIFDHLGDVYLRLGRPDDARTSWRRAEALAGRANPPDRRLPEIRRKLAALKDKGARASAPGERP
jgi:tetratricopeptide (TPR) repeat protein